MLDAVAVLAVNNFGDTRSGGLAGPMGLFMIVLLGVATVLLIRNMNARLRRLPDKFPDPSSGTDAPTSRTTDEMESASEARPDAPGERGERG